jgi:16S rRNA (cytosine1402-N4)-methyltransferase
LTEHVPVLTAEVVQYLRPGGGGVFVDCTTGLGGHASALLAAGATRVIGLDRDRDALSRAREALAPWLERVELVHADFRSLDAVLDRLGVPLVDGAVADLGVSSMQLDAPGRGFSFQRDEPLDMRMDRSGGETAADLVAASGERELADAIFQYGEERYSRRIARAIVDARRLAPIATTGQLAAIVRRAIPRRGFMRIDPATRTFQAIRIWVNRELEGLDRFLEASARRLRLGARLVVIAFHSLEDRIAKHTFRALERSDATPLKVLTKKPVMASDEEVQRNPRARSAKLRAAERVGAGTGR